MPPPTGVVFVAVPEDFRHGKSTLLWALGNLVKNDDVAVMVVHVHRVPGKGENLRDITVRQELVNDHRKKLRAEAEKKIDEYVAMCHGMKVRCEKLIIDKDDVAKGLEELIDRQGITKLVMGAAKDECYTQEMEALDSKTAIRLVETAASTCKIWFTCNGHLICTRETNTTTTTVPPRSHSDRSNNGIQGMQGCYEDSSDVDTMTDETAPHQIRNLEWNTTENREDLSDEAKESLPMAKGKERRYQQRNAHDVKEKKHPLTNMASQNLTEVRIEPEEPFQHVQMPRETDNVQNFTLEKNIEEIQREETAVTEDRSSLHEKSDEITAMALPPLQLPNTEFPSSELMKAMEHFNDTLLGEGRFGRVYKGFLRNTDVAIKRLHGETVQESDLNKKVAVLGIVRHPNLVTLIGVCREREALCLVYEFLPNGSLEDRLACRNKTPPLTWRVRTKIIYEMCSALIFLHSYQPQPVVHGDLKPSNVLLDANFVSKLGDFGICMDGDTTAHSDVHSFGVIILQLLTGLPPEPEDVVKLVSKAMEKKELCTVLDPTAGNWPIELASQLARIGLRCVRMNQEEHLDLVWKELESHKNACILTCRCGQGDDDPPSYFICPITKDVMEKPHFAADGHTYELEAIRGWIGECKSCGRKATSPMTNKELDNLELIPNVALSSEIKEWEGKQQQKQVRSLVCDPHPVPVQNTSAARSDRHNPLPANPNPRAAAPPSRPANPSYTFLPPPTTGIRRRHVNGHLPSSSIEADVPGPGETSRIRGKTKHD